MIRRFVCFLVLLVFWEVSHAARARELEGIRRNNEGVKNLEHEDSAHAEESFLKGLASDPFNPVLHMNLGWSYEAQKHYDRAIKEYESVLRAPHVPEDLKFTAHFNAGNAAAQNQDIPLALRHYQAALDLKPDSKEVKTNIELLFQGGSGKGKGGSGNGENQNQDQNQDQSQNQGENQDPNPNKQNGQNKPFQSENLTKEDVRKILEELKSQEKKIRAQEYSEKGSKEAPSGGKDW